MFVDQSSPQGAANAAGSLAKEYRYNGKLHRLIPFNPEDIVGDKDVKFHHGDLKFLSLLLRGHELEDHGLAFDAGCWTDVDKVLDRFSHCRQRRWRVRQLLRAVKADNAGCLRLLGVDVTVLWTCPLMFCQNGKMLAPSFLDAFWLPPAPLGDAFANQR